MPERNWTYGATILKVVDGDTFHAEVDAGFDIRQRMTLRLLGVDAPEVSLRKPNYYGPGVDEMEKARGIYIRDMLRERLTGEPVIVVTEKDRKEKYGRYLATVYHDDQNINELVVTTMLRWNSGR